MVYPLSCCMLMTYVLMAPTMEQLDIHVAEWRVSLLDKGLNLNAGKSKLMVGSRVRKMIVNYGKYPCGVWERSVGKLC